MKELQYINSDLLATVTQQAQSSSRRRKNYNFHQENEALNRLLNAVEPDSYVCPHRHATPPKDECILLLQGKGAAIVFEETGDLKQIYLLDPDQGKWGIDIPGGTFHTIIALKTSSVFYEVKLGPYVPTSDKEFASWAPREGDPEVPSYLKSLHQEVCTIMGVATELALS